jgi:hypothetical protein
MVALNHIPDRAGTTTATATEPCRASEADGCGVAEPVMPSAPTGIILWLVPHSKHCRWQLSAPRLPRGEDLHQKCPTNGGFDCGLRPLLSGQSS